MTQDFSRDSRSQDDGSRKEDDGQDKSDHFPFQQRFGTGSLQGTLAGSLEENWDSASSSFFFFFFFGPSQQSKEEATITGRPPEVGRGGGAQGRKGEHSIQYRKWPLSAT